HSFDTNNNAFNNSDEIQFISTDKLKLRKKKYLLTMQRNHNTRVSLYQLIQSIENEFNELIIPLNEQKYQLEQLRSTCNSFFKRNIQLTSRCLSLQKNIEILNYNYNEIKKLLRYRQIQENAISTTTPGGGQA